MLHYWDCSCVCQGHGAGEGADHGPGGQGGGRGVCQEGGDHHVHVGTVGAQADQGQEGGVLQHGDGLHVPAEGGGGGGGLLFM